MLQWTDKLRMIRLQKKFLLAGLIVNLIAGAVSRGAGQSDLFAHQQS
jgi:hypothetical protein